MNIKQEEFETLYKPLSAEMSGLTGNLASDLILAEAREKTHPGTVWTVVESDGNVTTTSGIHYVNREAYVFTEEPCNDMVDVCDPFDEITISMFTLGGEIVDEDYEFEDKIIDIIESHGSSLDIQNVIVDVQRHKMVAIFSALKDSHDSPPLDLKMVTASLDKAITKIKALIGSDVATVIGIYSPNANKDLDDEHDHVDEDELGASYEIAPRKMGR